VLDCLLAPQFGILRFQNAALKEPQEEQVMNADSCLIGGCTEPLYAPAGTQSLCKEHFVHFVAWRKKKGGLGMFKKYSAMSMEERDAIVEEWAQTVSSPSAS
jgi:hypothetical protein